MKPFVKNHNIIYVLRITFYFAIAAMTLWANLGFSQTEWKKYPGNPVLDLGASGTWDDTHVYGSAVLFDGKKYQIWYGGHDGLYGRIGYATSADGIAWVKHPDNPVLNLGASGTWDDVIVSYPTVLFDGAKYQMWYTGGSKDRIGYATSADGIVWEKHPGNPVLDLGANGTWDDYYVGWSTVLFDGANYRMWYTGYDGSNYKIGYATSTDGIVWVKHPDNPVLDFGPSGTWDDAYVGNPTVLFDGKKYQMWYNGNDGSNGRIGYATSADGIVWVKHPDNPVLDHGASGTWDFGVGSLTVLLNRTEYQMWYTGSDGSNDRIGYATSALPFPVGDVSGNGQVTAYDAALILQYTVGLIDHFPVEDMMSPSVGVPRDYIVRMPEAQAKAGDRIYVPVAINDATGLVAGGITIKYDSAVLKAVRVLADISLQGAYWEANTNIKGEVRIAFAAAKPTKEQGNLLTVEFEVLPNTEGKTTPLIFDNVSLSDSLNITKNNGSITVLAPNFALLQNYPNPFNPETWLPYQLAQDAKVTIIIHNSEGQIIRVIDLGQQVAGSYLSKNKAAYWNGHDNSGQPVASGLYFYTLRAGKYSATRRMVVVK
jgi:predicted GH43/DUF377 family glycosyl hydrolase